MLTFRNTGKQFELQGDLVKLITCRNYNVDLASLSDKKLLYDFAEEMYFDIKATFKISTRDRSLITLLKSPGTLASAFGVSSSQKPIFLSSDPYEPSDRIKLLVQEKEAGNNSDLINKEIVPIVDKLLRYKCMSTKQHRILLRKRSN